MSRPNRSTESYRGLGRAGRSAVAIGLIAAASAAPAAGVINAPHGLNVGLRDNWVLGTGFSVAESPVTVEVHRGGLVIGQAVAAVNALTGEFAVNTEPGDPCWVGGSPDIAAGDRIVLKPSGKPAEEGSALPFLEISEPSVLTPGVAAADPSDIQFTGRATTSTGVPLDLGTLSHRLQSRSGPFSDGTVTFNAPAAGITFAAAAPAGSFTLTYGPLAAGDLATAQGARSELTWTVGSESVVEERVAVGNCPGLVANGARQTSASLITQANQDLPLTVSGIAQGDAVQATVTIDDTGHPETPPLSVIVDLGSSSLPAGKTWTTQLSGLRSLADGPLSIQTQVLLVGSLPPLDGAPMQVNKLAAPPPAPQASPAPGTFTGPTVVGLAAATGAGGASTIRYTLDGSAPTGTSPVVPSAGVQIGASSRLRAVAIDGQGNRSAELDGLYRVIEAARNTTTGADRQAISADNVTKDMVVTGTAQLDTGALTLRLIGVGGFATAQIPATLGDAPGARTWRVVVPGRVLGGLPEGPITLIPTYTIAGVAFPAGVAPLPGGTLTLIKDTFRPAPPGTISPAPGPFAPFSPPVVTIAGCPAGSVVRYTTTGRAPTTTSVATVPIRLPVGKTTTLTAACVDAAGNVSSLVRLRYRPNAALLGLGAQTAILSRGATTVVDLSRARVQGVGMRVRLPLASKRATLQLLRAGDGKVLLVRTRVQRTATRDFRFTLPAGVVRGALTKGIVRARIDATSLDQVVFHRVRIVA